MATKMLRGREPLTTWRGRGGPGGNLYRGSLLDPRLADPDDVKRLVAEGFVEWVVPDGENWRLAEDTDSGDKGDSVTVGDVGIADPNGPDNGTVNVEAAKPVDAEADARRAAARQKLAESGGTPHGNAGKDVWVEYAVAQGVDRGEAEKVDKADLVAALKK